jgi:uncharacterized protein
MTSDNSPALPPTMQPTIHPTIHPTSHPVTGPAPMDNPEFEELDNILDDLRGRFDETPQWEFCEGFMVALICCRRVIHASEYLPVLLDVTTDGSDGIDETGEGGFEGSFADDAQLARFMALWTRRWNEIAYALNLETERLDDEYAYHPEVMDVRGALAALPPEERDVAPSAVPGEATSEVAPSFGQVWALGFMFAVECWPDEWDAPRDKKLAKAHDEALDAIITLTEGDTAPATLNAFDDTGPPSVSEQRLDEFADAVWAVYDLRAIWRDVGPRVAPARAAIKPGRNDPCFCGSGKKFKKCHGAA